MKRRTFLAAAPLAVPTMTKAEADQSQILRLFHRHRAILDAARRHVCNVTGRGEDAELDLLFYRHSNKIEEEMMSLPSTCAADFAAKVIVETVCGQCGADWETSMIWKEARLLVGVAPSAR
ncbi:hypothetical protein [Rhodovulum sp. MB263]|uniref:hypothetical protein n=1 Tax=Rhodovulum sp. (strain MB263) TaxID=308754 RepID=UPI0009B798C4|nr:hypothetical protein [Rhodovulum sp. MB263]ARC87902.1 hypothetical protein B5V46_04350 [Rhodovulum sp. MB263]